MPKYWEPPEAGVGGPEPIAPIYRKEPREDKELQEGVRTAFFLDPDLDESQFEIRVVDGVVHLHGTVQSEETRQKATQVALGVEGVKDVRDHLVVGRRG